MDHLQHVASLWVGLSVCIPTYMLAAGLVQGGMSWWQAMLTILLGNLIVLVPMVLIAHPGTRFGIPFPVLARASFGTRGANVPAILRGLVACGWFGIQTWIGGQAIHTMLRTAFPAWERVPGGSLDLLLRLLADEHVRRGAREQCHQAAGGLGRAVPDRGRPRPARLGRPARRAGLGPVLAQPSQFRTTGEFLAFFVPSLTAMVGFWATLALNIPDLSRYAASQRAQIRGQLYGLPTTMTLFSFIGVAVTSASVLLFGEAIWDPVVLLSRLGNPAGHPDLAVRRADRDAHHQRRRERRGRRPTTSPTFGPRGSPSPSAASSPGSSASSSCPGGCSPTYGAYIFGWLVGYSSFLGPIAGIFIADYWLIRKARLSLPDLYTMDGLYGRWNWKAMISLAAGVGPRPDRPRGARACACSTTTPGSWDSAWRSSSTGS